MTVPSLKETHLEGVDLDDASDVDELFSVLSGSAPAAPEGGEAPGAAPPPPAQAEPEPVPAVVPASTDQATPAEPVSTPEVSPPPAQAVPAAPLPVPAAPAPVVEPVVAAPQPEPAPVNMQELVEKQLSELTKQYVLNEEDAKGMLTEPEVVLPKLAARMHQQMLQAVQQTLVQQLPQLIHSVTESRVRESEAQNRFFSRWPQLRPHQEAVMRVGQMFRAANPKATPDEAVEQIGKIVAMSLGVAETPGQPVTQASPSVPATAPVAPHRPAAAGGTPMVTKPANPNEWAAFADDDLRSNF